MGRLENPLADEGGMAQGELLSDQRPHRPSKHMRMPDTQRVQESGTVFGELDDGKRPCARFRTTDPAVVEHDDLKVLCEPLQQRRFQKVHRTCITHDHEQRVTAAEHTSVHRNVCGLNPTCDVS